MNPTKFVLPTEKFFIDLSGELTGLQYTGHFTVRTLLTQGEQMQVDRIRRELVGINQDQATPKAFSTAAVLAELAVRVTEAPDWWTSAGRGQGLYDNDIVSAVYKAAMEAETKFLTDLKDKAALAKGELRNLAPTEPK